MIADAPAERSAAEREPVEPEPVPEAPAEEAPAEEAPATDDTAPGKALERRPETVPELARMAAGAWLRATTWSLEISLRVGSQLLRAATDPELASQLGDEFSEGVRTYAREFLGIAELDERVRRLAPVTGLGGKPSVRLEQELRERGAELLAHSADVYFDDDAHPAYGRILSEMVPDEGRVLRLLASSGAQPLVDVRASNLIGVGSQLIKPRMNMIGAQAGLRHRDRVGAYLNNLFRLGLIAFSEAPVADPIAYQVLEAQPEMLKTIKDTSRARTVHSRVELTPFGEDFCRVCLPLEPAEQRALPESTGSRSPI